MDKDDIYDILKQRILSLEAVPYEKISENKLAKELNVSRTLLRSAIARLEDENLLYVVPQSGTVVTPIRSEYVEQTIFASITILGKLIDEVCSRIWTDEERARMIELQTQISLGIEQSNVTSEERLERVLELRNLLIRMGGHEVAEEFLDVISGDYWRILQLQYETFSTSAIAYPMSFSQRADIMYRMLIDYLLKGDAVAAKMLLQESYNTMILQMEHLKQVNPSYFADASQ